MQVKMFNWITWKPNCPSGEIPKGKLQEVSLDRYGKELFIKVPESQAEIKRCEHQGDEVSDKRKKKKDEKAICGRLIWACSLDGYHSAS